MGGCRRLTDEEIGRILTVLALNRYPLRDQALFLLGIKTGFRISELLSLRIGDVFENGAPTKFVSVQRKHMKKKTSGRTVPLHADAQVAIKAWVESLGPQDPKDFLFRSRQKGKAIGRIMAWTMLRGAYKKCGLDGRLGTHSMRKTFAGVIHKKLGNDIFKTQKAMGHASLNSTAAYLAVDQDEIDEAIRKS